MHLFLNSVWVVIDWMPPETNVLGIELVRMNGNHFQHAILNLAGLLTILA
jgi:hypothetical protein